MANYELSSWFHQQDYYTVSVYDFTPGSKPNQ